MSQEKNNYIAVYGTLRKPISGYAFDVEYVREEIKLQGYQLQDCGLPRTKYTGDSDDHVVVDLLRCDDRNKDAIDSMELGAGYRISSVIIQDENGEDVEATIYLCDNINGTPIHDFVERRLQKDY